MICRQIFKIFLLLMVSLQPYYASDIPGCNFEDTVDLTHAQQFPNGSYLYGEDVVIPPDQVGTYDYELIFNGERVARDPHPRGCVCKAGVEGLRHCIKFCCHPTKEVIWNNTRECGDLYEVPKYDHSIKVISANGTRRKTDITKEFTPIMGIPCENAYALNPVGNLHEKWDLMENGSLLIYYNLRVLSKRDYCMMPTPIDGDINALGQQWELSPMVCPEVKITPFSNYLKNMAEVISITFIILTVLVILVKPEKCNLQENCLLTYLIALAIANIISTTLTISNSEMESFLCSFTGFSGYFFSMVSFFWLNVIYFDLLKSIVNRENHFLTYNIYGWGIPLALTGILIILQNSSMMESLKPGIGVDECWFDAYNWSALFYYYVFQILLLCLNIFYYFTAVRKMKTTLQYQPTRKDDLLKSANQYGRLLAIMVVLCCFETISNIESVLHPDSESIWFFITDLICATEGPLIFWIFAVKPIIDKRRRCQQTGDNYDTLDEAYTLEDAAAHQSPDTDYVKF